LLRGCISNISSLVLVGSFISWVVTCSGWMRNSAKPSSSWKDWVNGIPSSCAHPDLVFWNDWGFDGDEQGCESCSGVREEETIFESRLLKPALEETTFARIAGHQGVISCESGVPLGSHDDLGNHFSFAKDAGSVSPLAECTVL